MDPSIPESIEQEHEELRDALVRATHVEGRTGLAAREVARLFQPHILKEEEYALPPLGLLAPLARGERDVPDKAEAVAMAGRLGAELPRLLAEHREIAAALDAMVAAAREEGREDLAGLARRLALHARTEEEVLYPAAVLVGEHLKLRRRLGR